MAKWKNKLWVMKDGRGFHMRETHLEPVAVGKGSDYEDQEFTRNVYPLGMLCGEVEAFDEYPWYSFPDAVAALTGMRNEFYLPGVHVSFASRQGITRDERRGIKAVVGRLEEEAHDKDSLRERLSRIREISSD